MARKPNICLVNAIKHSDLKFKLEPQLGVGKAAWEEPLSRDEALNDWALAITRTSSYGKHKSLACPATGC